MKKIELLAPAGNLEKLEIAVDYGADAVYMAGKQYGLRGHADNFTYDEMIKGIEYAHSRSRKAYIAMNIVANDKELDEMPEFIRKVEEAGIDAFIVTDPAVIELVKENAPQAEIHLSTQANCTSLKNACFWYKMGISRVILAREMSLNEIRHICAEKPEGLKIEAFVHGAMCISYSGRCLLSSYMSDRSPNKGLCSHPCRWNYNIVEEKRPGEFFPVFENEKGTFIFNSRDLCMIGHIPELIESGLSSLKIEGRMKSINYVATTVKAYRTQIDRYYEDKENYELDNKIRELIKKASHRQFTTGFYFGAPGREGQVYTDSSYIRPYEFIAKVIGYDEKDKAALIEQRNRFFTGEELEVMQPQGYEDFKIKVESITDLKGNEHESMPHPKMKVYIPVDKKVVKNAILRRRIEN